MTRYCCTLIIVFSSAYTTVAVTNENAQSDLDMILSNIKVHRNRIVTWKADYKLVSVQKQDEQYDSGDAPMKRISSCNYLRDRSTGRFMFQSDSVYGWHVSRKTWMKKSYRVANDGDRHVLFSFTDQDLNTARGCPQATISNAEDQTKVTMTPSEFFMDMGKLTLDEYLESARGAVSDVIRLDDFRYKIILRFSDEERKGIRIEYVFDSRFDWNLVSEHTYDASGRLAAEKTAEFEMTDGVPFVKSGYYAHYADLHSDEPTETRHLTVDMNTVQINLPVKDEDFHIDLPEGTHVYVRDYDLQYTIGGDMVVLNTSVDAAEMDPAVKFASKKELDEFPEQTKRVSVSVPVDSQHTDSADVTADKKEATASLQDSAIPSESNSHLRRLVCMLLSSIVVVALVILRRMSRNRKGAQL